MASKNRLKPYEMDGYYHLYNRGVGKELIFLDHLDYRVLISYLKEYLSPPKALSEEEAESMGHRYICKNYYGEIELISFCLMPNHYHFLLKQTEPHTITDFMKSLFVRYSGYFNKRHDRVGHVFQDIYKGILIKNDEYLWWLSRYIHRNPVELLHGKPLSSYPFSSYTSYYSNQFPEWIHPEILLAEFQSHDYCLFVEDLDEVKVPEFIDDYYIDRT